MKKISFLLFLFMLFPSFIYSSNSNNLEVEVQYEWFELNNLDNKNNLALQIKLIFPNENYTYSPLYSSYPTQFIFSKINHTNSISYDLYFEKVETSYDSLTKKDLELYMSESEFYLIFSDINQNIIEEKFNLELSLLLCSEKNCTPFEGNYEITLPDKSEALKEFKHFESFQNSKSYTLKKISSININSDSYLLENDKINSKSTLLTTNINHQNIPFEFSPVYFNKSQEVESFSFAIIIGFIAGFILNLMPCVLPVVAIKIASLVQISQISSQNKNSLIRMHGIFFALGVLTLFSLLAFLISFFDFVWGGLFQSVYFIISLAGFLFLLGLSFLGFFSFPLINIREPKTFKNNYFESYFQGLVITLIATPCSGPLLGGVLGFGLTLPVHLLFLLLLSTGLGMASPYLLLSVFPNLVRFLPKSGPWMLVLEQVLAFILFATSIYLLSFLSADKLFVSVIYLFLVALFVWIYRFFRNSKHATIIAVLLFIIHSSLSIYFLDTDKKQDELLWNNYSYSQFSQNLTQKPMLVTFTADWCPTCKILENTILTKENIQPLVEEYGLELIKVDITQKNNEKEELLKSLGSASIPLLAIFPRSVFAYQPIVLRDIYTLKQIKEAIENNLEKIEN